MQYGLSQQVIDSIQKCLRTNERIEQAILYGSRSKGNYTAGSDIDLTLIGSGLTLQDVYRLEDSLDDLLLPYRFDISLYHHIENPDLVEHIHQMGVVFYQAEKVVCTS